MSAAQEKIARLRVIRQGLENPRFATPDAVVRWFGAMQAQDYALAKWSVGQRTLEGSEMTVDAALADGAILRTHVLRPTWHLVARDDLRWMLALTAPRVLARMAPYDRRTGLDAATVTTSTRAIAAAIRKSGHLTRAAVAGALTRKGIPAQAGWLVGLLLMHAELRGVVCSGRPHGAVQTWALVDERAPTAVPMPRDEAMAELARRYFQGHAPATERDYRWWSGLGAADVRRSIDMLGTSLERVRVGDTTYLVHESGPLEPGRVMGAHLLQAFDELVVAYSETRDVVDAAGLVRTRKPEGLLTRSVLLGGQVVGRWRGGAVGARTVHMDVLKPARPGVRAALERAVQGYARFLQQPLELSVTFSRSTK
jgi:hypothetical protein